MNIKKYIRILVLYSLCIFLGYTVYYFIKTPINSFYDDCGVIESKSNDEVVIKYGKKTELYLNIQFEKTGFKSILCEPTTYFKYKKGERVCFNLQHETTLKHVLLMSCGLSTIIIITLVFIFKYF